MSDVGPEAPSTALITLSHHSILSLIGTPTTMSTTITYSFLKTKGRSKSVMREALAQGSQTLRLKVGLGTA